MCRIIGWSGVLDACQTSSTAMLHLEYHSFPRTEGDVGQVDGRTLRLVELAGHNESAYAGNAGTANEIAGYLMTAYLPREDHLKAAMSFAWSLEMMGHWERALEHYELLETIHGPKLAAYMATHRARVLHKLGREDEARQLLERVEADLSLMSEGDRNFVAERIREVRNLNLATT